MDRDLVGRVSRAMLLLLLPLAAGAGLVAGPRGAAGALAGAGIALLAFRWVSRGVQGGIAAAAGGRVRPVGLVALGLRHAALFGAVALALGSGRVDPLALVAGLSLLPPVVVVVGLRTAGASS
jgi:hypothetical protein